MAAYIHLTDPGFPEPPWPNERRLGPFLTDDEALVQAVEDGARGSYAALGVYDERESEIRGEDDRRQGKATYTAAQIAKRADARRQEIAEEAARVAETDRAALESMLPPGVTLEALEKAGLAIYSVGRPGA